MQWKLCVSTADVNAGAMQGDMNIICNGTVGSSDYTCFYMYIYAQDITGQYVIMCFILALILYTLWFMLMFIT